MPSLPGSEQPESDQAGARILAIMAQMRAEQAKLRGDMVHDTRRFTIWALVAGCAIFGIGAAVGGGLVAYVQSQQAPPLPQITLNPPPVTVAAPNVTVHPPNVTVSPPSVSVAAPNVTVYLTPPPRPPASGAAIVP